MQYHKITVKSRVYASSYSNERPFEGALDIPVIS